LNEQTWKEYAARQVALRLYRHNIIGQAEFKEEDQYSQ